VSNWQRKFCAVVASKYIKQGDVKAELVLIYFYPVPQSRSALYQMQYFPEIRTCEIFSFGLLPIRQKDTYTFKYPCPVSDPSLVQNQPRPPQHVIANPQEPWRLLFAWPAPSLGRPTLAVEQPLGGGSCHTAGSPPRARPPHHSSDQNTPSTTCSKELIPPCQSADAHKC